MSNEAEIKARLKFEGDEGARKFKETVSEMERGADAGAARITAVAGRLAVAGGFLVGAAIGVTERAMGYAKSLDEGSRLAGVAVERYQTLTKGLERLGVAPQRAEEALRALNGTLGEVQSGTAAKGAAAALERMGVSSRILSGEISTADGLLDAVAGSSKRFGTEAQFTASLVDVLGKSVGTDLAAALQDGGDALRQQEEDIRTAGDVIRSDYIKALADAQQQVDDFTAAVSNKITIWAGVAVTELQRVARNFQITQEASTRAGEEYLGGLIVTRQRMPKGGRGGGRSETGSAFRYLSDRDERSGALGATAAAAAKAEEERAKREREAKAGLAKLDRERAREQREAERARDKALDRELELLRRQGEAAEDLLRTTERLRGSFADDFDAQLRRQSDLFNQTSSIFDAGGPEELKAMTEDALRRAGYGAEKVAKTFENEGIVAAQAIALAFGGRVGGEVTKIAGLLRGLAGEDFNSMGGRWGGALTLAAGAKGSERRREIELAIRPLTESLEKSLGGLLEKLGLDPSAAGGVLKNSMIGFGIGSAIGGNTESGIGGAIGGNIGSAIGSSFGPAGGVVGQVLGSIIGSGIGGLFAGAKKGSVTIGASGGEFTVGDASGNSASRKANASAMGGSISDTLNTIAEALGAGIGSFSVSVGQRDGVFSVDPTGRGMVSKKYGAVQFATAEEAARYAVADILKDGGLTGLSPTVMRALQSGSTIEKGLEDAVAIQSIATRLRAIEDPVGAAIDALVKEFDGLRETLIANGASAAELAELEKLYGLEREEVTKQSLATLQAFKDSLNMGSNSPLSLGDQRVNAEEAFARFEQELAAGRTIDQGAFVQAGQTLLDIDRQIYGGTSSYFDTFNRVQGATDNAIGGIQNATSIREAEIAAASKSTADSTAALVNGQNEANVLLAQIMAALTGSGGGGGGAYASAVGAGFARAV